MSPQTPRLLLVAAALLSPLAVAGTAHASQVVRDGDALVFRADPGVENHAAIRLDDFDARRITFSDRSESDIVADPALGCETSSSGFGRFAHCPYEGVAEIRLETGDGDDELDVDWDDLPTHLRYVADGGPGDDHLEGVTADHVPVTMHGGDGDDTMLGGMGRETFHGGPGDDVLDGDASADALFGGDGDDVLRGGPDRATDTIDGGPGRDAIENDWYDANALSNPPIKVTLDGVANDGRPGENDDVVSVERVKVAVAATLVAGAEPVEFDVEKSEAPGSRLVGSPGADRLATYVFDDHVDGRGGRDVIFTGMGDDVVEARDGVKDVIDCSDGAKDVARVDRVDVTSGCERVKVKGGKGKRKGGGR